MKKITVKFADYVNQDGRSIFEHICLTVVEVQSVAWNSACTEVTFQTDREAAAIRADIEEYYDGVDFIIF